MSHLALIVALITLFAGMVLGLRFKVLILLPAIACGFPLGFVLGFARADALWAAALMAAVAVISLQIGYLAGAGFRYGLHAQRFTGIVSNLFGGSHTPRRSIP